MRSWKATLLLLLPLTQLIPLASAQDAQRDPTAWPPALRSAVASAQAASGASDAPSADNAIRQVVFAAGHAYVVQRGRRYAVGDAIDGARIERINEQAVWLREPSGQLRRESLYSGVEKRAPAAASIPARAASGTQKSKEKP